MALVLATAPLPAKDTNLVPNGTFSAGVQDWGVGSAGILDTTVYKTPDVTNDAGDTNSLRITAAKLWETVGPPRLPVVPEVDYHIACWMKLDKAVQAHVKFHWMDAAGQRITTEYLCTGMDGTVDWFEKSGIFTAPANAVAIELIFLSGGQPEAPGTLWIDRVVVEPWAAPSTSMADWQQALREQYGEDKHATPMTEKVIYYDVRHDICGVSNIEPLVHFFKSRDFAVKDADEVKRWMQEKTVGGADGTVCILAMGVIPDILCESKASPTFKTYMEAGGRVVWIGDVPLFYLSHTDRLISDCGWDVDVLGYRHGPWNSQKPGVTTATGRQWGMERLDDTAARPVLKDSVTLVFSEQPGTDLACSYLINYGPRFPYSGFIRFYGAGHYDGASDVFNEDLYRLALFRGETVAVPTAPAWMAPEEEVTPITVATRLRNVRRGDTIRATVTARNSAQIRTMSLTLLDGDVALERFDLPVRPTQEIAVETADLAPARDYVLRAEASDLNGTTVAATQHIYLAPVKTAKLPVGMYAVGSGSTEAKSDIVLRDLAAHLGEGGLISLNLGEGYSFMADQALRYDLAVVGVSGCYYTAALPADVNPELHMRLSNGELPLAYHYSCLGDGKAPVCMGNPINRATISAALKQDVARFTGYPAFSERMFVSDDCGMFGDPGTHQLVCYCPYCTGTFKKMTGHEAPLTAAADILRDKGIVDDQDTWYQWMRFRTGTVYGEWNSSMRQAAQTVSPGIKIAPLPAGMGGSPVLNAAWAFNPPDTFAGTGISSYYYYPSTRVPPTCQLLHAEVAMMGNRQNELWPMPQSSDWDHAIASPDDHAALVKGQYFNLLAAGASTIVYFHYPLMPGTKAWEAFKSFAPLGTTLGPLLLNSPKSARHVAVLASFCNEAYRWCAPGGPPPNCADVYLDLRRNGIQADVVSDEEIGAGMLENYRVLVVGNDATMLDSVHKRIQEFAAGGGTVLLDQDSKIAITGALLTAPAQLPDTIRRRVPQPISVSTQSIIASEFDAGSARLFVLANSTITKVASGNVTIPGYVLYNLREGIPMADGSLITLPPGDGALIFAVPTAPNAIVAQIDPNGISAAVVDREGTVIEASFPIHLKVFRPDGTDAPEYADYHVTSKGRLSIKPFLARNDAKGPWTAEIRELASGITTRIEFSGPVRP